MPKAKLMHLAGKHRTKEADTELGVMLAFIAGAVNAGGFLAVGAYTSHMTGVVSSIADYIATNAYQSAAFAFSYLCAFVAGAGISAFIINFARARHYHSEFALALMLEAVLLLIFGICADNLTSDFITVHIIIMILCLLMGLQNAIITKISHSEIRTTHVTGIATDIGIEIGRHLFARTHRHIDVRVHPERLRFYVSIISAFAMGGIVGALSFNFFGFTATIPLALVLAFMALFPILEDLRGTPRT